MRQTCDDHGKYVAGCDECRIQKREYLRVARGARQSTSVGNTNAAGPHLMLRRRIEAIDEWGDQRACRGKTDVMFPEHPTGRGRSADWRAARRICASCPVVEECWAWVVRNFPPFELRHSGGMWAGRTPSQAEREIRAMRRQS